MPLYSKSKILKFKDQVSLENFFFIHKDVQADLPAQLLNTFSVKPGTPGSLQIGMVWSYLRLEHKSMESIVSSTNQQLPGIL